jgi:hypothetical protein
LPEKPAKHKKAAAADDVDLFSFTLTTKLNQINSADKFALFSWAECRYYLII